jgi:hypothetical protein
MTAVLSFTILSLTTANLRFDRNGGVLVYRLGLFVKVVPGLGDKIGKILRYRGLESLKNVLRLRTDVPRPGGAVIVKALGFLEFGVGVGGRYRIGVRVPVTDDINSFFHTLLTTVIE